MAKSNRTVMRSAAVCLIGEIVATFDEKEMREFVMPVLLRLSGDPDENVQIETVNCVGTVCRFTTADDTLGSIREMLDEWIKGRPFLRMCVLKAINANVKDIDSHFRDGYIMPKLAECTVSGFLWGEFSHEAMVVILQILSSLKNEFSDYVSRNSVVPMIQALSENASLSSDATLRDLKEHFQVGKGKSK
jgi:hypothetical protein